MSITFKKLVHVNNMSENVEVSLHAQGRLGCLRKYYMFKSFDQKTFYKKILKPLLAIKNNCISNNTYK